MKAMISPPEMREPDAPQRSPTLFSLISDPAVKGLWGRVRVFDVVLWGSCLHAYRPVIRADTEPGTDSPSVAPRTAPGGGAGAGGTEAAPEAGSAPDSYRDVVTDTQPPSLPRRRAATLTALLIATLW